MNIQVYEQMLIFSNLEITAFLIKTANSINKYEKNRVIHFFLDALILVSGVVGLMSIHPFSIPLILNRGALGERRGTPWTGQSQGQHIETQPLTLTFTPTGNLTVTSEPGAVKQYPEKTPQARGQHADSTQRAPRSSTAPPARDNVFLKFWLQPLMERQC